jgi:hypothetical protein
MPRYEVFVPAAPPAVARDETLVVEGDSWLGALRAGLARLGGGKGAPNLLCDVKPDGSIHVTDVATGAALRIREVETRAPAAPPPPRIGRPSAPAASGDVLSVLFAHVPAVKRLPRREALGALLDLALAHADCDAGTLFLAEPSGALRFAVVRGPRAEELERLGLTIPAGVGLAGFSAQERACVAVSDAAKDPRFHRAVSQAIGYETRSLLCAPMARGPRVLGVVEVLNKRGGAAFGPTDVAVVSYLALQAAEVAERPA